MNLIEDLQAPFESRDVEWRIGRSGVKKDGGVWASALAYLTNRAIMARLDTVVGPDSWKNEFKEWNVGGKAGVLCGISIKQVFVSGAHEWVTKWDGAENTDIESVKGGLSDAMKRAAVQWGIGRYLYGLEETFVETSKERRDGWKYGKIKEPQTVFFWKEPALPAWALPKIQTASPANTLTLEQVKSVRDKLKNTNITNAEFLAWVSKRANRHVKELADIPLPIYQQTLDMLDSEATRVSA